MSLLETKGFSISIKKALEEAQDSVSIYSAFIKSDAIRWLFDTITDDIKVEVISRWQKMDNTCFYEKAAARSLGIRL